MVSALDDFLPNDVATLRRRFGPILQTTAAAVAAWQISRWLLPSSAPTYAILAVVTGMNVHPGSRGKWMLQVTLGAIMGVLVANVAGRIPAPETVQILVAVFLTLCLGVLFYSHNWFLINAAAGGVIPVAHGAVGGGFTFTVGWQALIACGVALTITQVLFPADAAGSVRGELQGVLDGSAGELRRVAGRLRGRAVGATGGGPADASGDEDLDSRLTTVGQTLAEGRQITRLAPRRFSQRPAIRRYGRSHAELARLVDDLGGLGHLSERADAQGGRDRMADRCEALAEALTRLSGRVDDQECLDETALRAAAISDECRSDAGGSPRRTAVALVLGDVAADVAGAARALGAGVASSGGSMRDRTSPAPSLGRRSASPVRRS